MKSKGQTGSGEVHKRGKGSTRYKGKVKTVRRN